MLRVIVPVALAAALGCAKSTGTTGASAASPTSSGATAIAKLKQRVTALLVSEQGSEPEVSFPVEVTFDSDGASRVIVQIPLKRLKHDFQVEARRKGYEVDDRVHVLLDTRDPAPQIQKKQVSFSVSILKASPLESGPGATLISAADYGLLPPNLRDDAKEAGYRCDQPVVLRSIPHSNDLSVVPLPEAEQYLPRTELRRFQAGYCTDFASLDPTDQAKAVSLGYSEGSPVWNRICAPGELVPVTEVGAGPKVEILRARREPGPDSRTSVISVTCYEYMNDRMKARARELGYGAAGKIGIQYDSALGRMKVLAPAELSAATDHMNCPEPTPTPTPPPSSF